MEARLARAAMFAACLVSLGARYKSENFVVDAATPQIAQQVGQAAEKFRHDLAVDWLGGPLRRWSEPCPISVQVAANLGAGGKTSFMFDRGQVYGWRMEIQGPLDRVIDSVLPHEVTHTIFATHFRQPLPRWADEGACTTVEHHSERAKQSHMLIQFLRTGRGIPFSRMFVMKEYPRDVMPLYSQGYSLATFLIEQGGKRKYLDYLADGLRTEDWPTATKRHYGYATLGALQNSWLDWVKVGSPKQQPDSDRRAQPAELVAAPQRDRPEPNLIYRAQSEDPEPAGQLVPVAPRPGTSHTLTGNPAAVSIASQAQATVPPAGQATSGWHPRQAVADPPRQSPRAGEPSTITGPATGTGKVLLEWSRDIRRPPTSDGAALPMRNPGLAT